MQCDMYLPIPVIFYCDELFIFPIYWNKLRNFEKKGAFFNIKMC
jgi:hypothetical protein